MTTSDLRSVCVQTVFFCIALSGGGGGGRKGGTLTNPQLHEAFIPLSKNFKWWNMFLFVESQRNF